MSLEEWQLDTAQISIVNESEANEKIHQILNKLEDYDVALDEVSEYVFSSCDKYLQGLLTEEEIEDDEEKEFVCSRDESVEIAHMILLYFGWTQNKSSEQLQEEINQHVNNAKDANERVLAQLWEFNMTQPTTVKTIHYVNDVDVATLSRDQLHDTIKKLEKEIEELDAVKTKSKSITLAKEEAETTLAFVVEQVDAKI